MKQKYVFVIKRIIFKLYQLQDDLINKLLYVFHIFHQIVFFSHINFMCNPVARDLLKFHHFETSLVFSFVWFFCFIILETLENIFLRLIFVLYYFKTTWMLFLFVCCFCSVLSNPLYNIFIFPVFLLYNFKTT